MLCMAAVFGISPPASAVAGVIYWQVAPASLVKLPFPV